MFCVPSASYATAFSAGFVQAEVMNLVSGESLEKAIPVTLFRVSQSARTALASHLAPLLTLYTSCTDEARYTPWTLDFSFGSFFT